MKKTTKPPQEELALIAIGSRPIAAVRHKPIDELLGKPEYLALASEVRKRCGSVSRFHHVVCWPMTHWWDFQDWMNQVQYDLEQLFGPVVRLVSTQKQVHGGKVCILAFFEIGPISPTCSPLKVGSAWRQFLAAINED
jgi:hypothetical protein